MFERFAAALALSPATQTPGTPLRDGFSESTAGFTDLMERYAGCTFEHGAYRVFDAAAGAKAMELARTFFPEFGARLHPFAMDWLGRMFALDEGRVEGGDPQVMLLEPGTGDGLEVPYGLVGFHDELLVEDPEPAILPSFFAAWRAGNPDALPLALDKCVGYALPLFVGGPDTVDNLELSDWEVYWTIVGQLKLKTAKLPEGTQIRIQGSP